MFLKCPLSSIFTSRIPIGHVAANTAERAEYLRCVLFEIFEIVSEIFDLRVPRYIFTVRLTLFHGCSQKAPGGFEAMGGPNKKILLGSSCTWHVENTWQDGEVLCLRRRL